MFTWCNKPRLRAWARAPRGSGPRAWGRGLQGLGHKPHFFVVLKSPLEGGRRKGGRRLKRLPRRWGPGGKRARDPHPHFSAFSAVRERRRGPSPLLKASNTPPKVGGLPVVSTTTLNLNPSPLLLQVLLLVCLL